jgi:hypothetical protein
MTPIALAGRSKIAVELVAGRGRIRCLDFVVQLPQGDFQHHQIPIDSRTIDRIGLPIECLANFSSIRPERSN